MPRLTDMDIDTVSLVDKGANGRKFAVLKRASERGPMVSAPDITSDAPQATETDDTQGGLRDALSKIAGALGLSEDVEFVGFVDNDGNPLTPETVTKTVDAYRDFVLDALKVEKAGRKISGARMKTLKAAMAALGDLINGVEQGYWTPPTSTGTVEKGHEVDDMTEAELTALVEKTVSSTFESAFGEDGAGTQAIAKAIASASETKVAEEGEPKDEAPVADPAPAAPAAAPTEQSADLDNITKRLDEIAATNGQVIEAVAKVLDRVDALEGGRRQSAPSTEKPAGEKTITKREKGDLSPLRGVLTQ